MKGIKEFKELAKLEGVFFSNKENAGRNWAKSWGLSYWRDVWFFKEYEYKGYIYRSGKVIFRHGGYNKIECFVNGEEVSLYQFRKALAALN